MRLDDALKNISLIARVENEEITGITSVISLCEVLIHPLRNQNLNLKQRYLDILQNSPNFFTKSINSATAQTAASLRAKYNLRTPDALQIATALENGCDAFLCNDKDLKRVTELKILILDEIEL